MSRVDIDKFNPLGPVSDIRRKMRNAFLIKRSRRASELERMDLSQKKKRIETFAELHAQFDEMCVRHGICYNAQLASLNMSDLKAGLKHKDVNAEVHTLFFESLQSALMSMGQTPLGMPAELQTRLGMNLVDGIKVFPDDRLKATLKIANAYNIEILPKEKVLLLRENHPDFDCFNIEFHNAWLKRLKSTAREGFNELANQTFPIRYAIAKAYNKPRGDVPLVGGSALQEAFVQSNHFQIVVTEEGQKVLEQNHSAAYLERLLAAMNQDVTAWMKGKDIVSLCHDPSNSM